MTRERKGERLSLTELLAKPHQRIPRYKMLIQARNRELETDTLGKKNQTAVISFHSAC